LFPDGEGGNVCRSDGGETRAGEPKVSGSLVEKRDQMVEISSGGEGRESGWSTDSRRAALVVGHDWRCNLLLSISRIPSGTLEILLG